MPISIRKIVVDNSWKNMISFVYTNQKGERSVKKVEIYDVKDDQSFYGFDLKDQKIKLFKYNQMEKVIVEGEFTPREFSKEK